MLDLESKIDANAASDVSGEFLTIAGERYYAIRNVDKMAPFFVNVVSNGDHWLFASSSGGLTAGRVSPETALFPYITVDKIHESTSHTGSQTLLRVEFGGQQQFWEPFNREHDGRYAVSRHLYKSLSGNKLCFEEINHDLQLSFRYTWVMSDSFGFSRQCELQNLGKQHVKVELLDGLQNILPAGTGAATQNNTSNLVDAYKWTELDEESGLAIYALYCGISDRAEPFESLRANTVFCLGLARQITLISSTQLGDFRAGRPIQTETQKRGIRGAYFVNAALKLAPQESQQWQLVANIEQSQVEVIALRSRLSNPSQVAGTLANSVAEGSDELARLMASTDALQTTAEENVVAHHYANVLFNNLRGGIFDDQNNVSSQDFVNSVRHFNHDVYQANQGFLKQLPEKLDFSSLLVSVREQDDLQLERLCYEYLPIRFGRRHGDPSRPWNSFAIRVRDEIGNRLFSYEGNWRDIFQNWEALTFSYPEFVENVVARFVNASTMDGYNPYRINKEGIDWEVEELDNPWSYIGYWGDHQIIYLQKFLELSNRFHPTRLGELLRKPIFAYANVPYRIKPFEALLENPKSTVRFDHQLAQRIEHRVEKMGADGKLVLDNEGDVYQVNLLEKLLVPLLSKLGNLVIDGGIWLNTQRPEWNDANNALVGQGLSMVTLFYMRRYIGLLQQIISTESTAVDLSREVSYWLADTASALRQSRNLLGTRPISPSQRYESVLALGLAASKYRQEVYREESFSGKLAQPMETITDLLDDALAVIDHSIRSNRRDDGLYHAYNLLDIKQNSATIDTLYPMLEGQVAALSAGSIEPKDACTLLQALFDSSIYRPDQRSFMLYPDRQLPGFLEKNRIPAEEIETIPLLQRMLTAGDERFISRDVEGNYRFNADFANVDDLNRQLDKLVAEYGDELYSARRPLQELYHKIFDHRAFTGRSGGMFGFEGLGCIYWHMVSKLLLAIQENFFAALRADADEASCKRLGHFYYRVREGLGFNKAPAEYGAFPTDPYSHTPKHAGAQQPGMTGQVKEEVLSRFGELGVRVADGVVRFRPDLLRACEFLTEPREFRVLDVDNNWIDLTVPAGALAFTWCQVPVVYKLDNDVEPSLCVIQDDGKERNFTQLALPAEDCAELFGRSGRIRQLSVTFRTNSLFVDQSDVESHG